MNNRGYIAVTTAIILSIVIMVVAIALGSSNLLTRLNFVAFTNKQTTYFVARSCLSHALFQLIKNISYAGNENVNAGSYQCSIQPIETSGLNKIIKARAQINGATTNFKLTVTTATLSTVSLEELVKF